MKSEDLKNKMAEDGYVEIVRQAVKSDIHVFLFKSHKGYVVQVESERDRSADKREFRSHFSANKFFEKIVKQCLKGFRE